eukprot:jgi/Hompol1/3327/HPOL_003201-RA
MLDSSTKDFELLSIDWDRLNRLVGTKNADQRKDSQGIVDSVRDQLEGSNKLKEKLQIYQDRRKNDLEKQKELGDRLAEREMQIVKLQEQIGKYEDSYGIKEAVLEIKNLKLQLNIRNREIKDLTQQISDLDAKTNDLNEENDDLRVLLCKHTGQTVDLTTLRGSKAIEHEKERSLNIRLRQEIDNLERERLELKAALRMHALERGERAIGLGLTSEDLAAVEEYAEKLRMGQQATSTDSDKRPTEHIVRPVLNIAQLDKLTLELERAHVDGSETKEHLLKLQDEHKKLLDENHLIQTALIEISQTLIESAQRADEVEQLIQVLQDRYHKSSASETIVNVEKSLVKINKQLRNDLERAQSRQTDLVAEVEKLNARVAVEQAEVEAWKRKSQIKKAKSFTRLFVNLPEELTGKVSTEGYAMLVDQLILCLAELREKDDELQACSKTVARAEAKYDELFTKSQMLYRDHQRLKQTYEQEVTSLRLTAKEAESRLEAAQVRISALETLTATTEKSADDIQRATIEAHRKLVVMQVNERMLTRRYLALTDVEQLLRKEHRRVKEDMIGMDKAARETILRLHRQRNEALDKVQHLQQQLSESVPQSQHTLLSNRLKTQIAKTKLLLDRERDGVERRIDQEDARNEVTILRKQLEQLETKLEESSAKVGNRKLPRTLFESMEQVGDVSHYRQAAASLEVQVCVLQKRTELAENKATALENIESDMKAQLDALDRMYTDAKQESIGLQEELLALQNEYSGGATAAVYQQTLSEIKSMQEEQAAFKAEVQKCKSIELLAVKDLCDIATNQAADLEHLHKLDQKEQQILHAAVQELQMEDDDKLIIGRLHHHILALQLSETMALRKVEALSAKCMRLETVSLQMEQARDDRDRLMFSLRLETKARIRLMQTTVSELRMRLAGMVLFGKHERACNTIQRLDQKKQQLETRLAVLAADKRDIEVRLDDASVRLSSQEELLAALRDASNAQKRVAAWHSRMLATQTDLLRAQKDAADFELQAASSSRECQANQARIGELEEELLNLQDQFDQHQMEWETRQGELEMTIQRFEEERDQIFHCATAAEARQQLELALRLLVDRSRQIKIMEVKMDRIEKEKVDYSQKDFAETIQKKDADLIQLQLYKTKVETKNLVEHEHHATVSRDTNALEMARERETDAIRIAKSTIESLRRQIESKDELVNKYREMVKSTRKEIAAQKHAHRLELDKQAQLIDQLRADQINRAVKVPQLEPQVSQRDAEFERSSLLEMEKLLQAKSMAKETAIADLQKSLDEMTERATSEKQQMEATISQLKQDLSDRESDIAHKIAELESLGDELRLAKEIASRPQPKDLTDVVQRLEADLEQREAKISSLTKVIGKLKAQLVEMAKDSAELKLRQSSDNINFQQQLEVKTSELTSKIIQLEGKLKRMSATIESHKQEESDLVTDLRRMSDELAKKDKELLEKSSENVRLHKALRESAASHADEVTKPVPNPNVLAQPELPNKLDDSVLASKMNELAIRSSGGMVGVTDPAALKEIKWELDKKYTQKIETLKKKLGERILCCDELTKSLETVKQSLSRSENDRLKLQSKLSSLTQKMQAFKGVSLKEPRHADLLNSEPTRDLPFAEQSSTEAANEAVKRLQSELDIQLEKLSTAENEKTKAETAMLSIKFASEKQSSDARHLRERIAELEQLRGENEQLRKSAVTQNASAKSLDLALEVKKLKKQLASVDDKQKGSTESPEKISKIEEENTKIRKQLRREMERVKAQTIKVEELTIAKQHLIDEVVTLRKALGGIEITPQVNDELVETKRLLTEAQKTLEEKEAVIAKLLRPDANEQSRLISENRRLQRELEMWTARANKLSEKLAQHNLLGATGQTQHQNEPVLKKIAKLEQENRDLHELEDLKFNYRECMKLNVMYEEQLKQLRSRQS